MIEPITFLTKPTKIHCRLRFSRKYELRSFYFLSIRLTVDGTATLITCSYESREGLALCKVIDIAFISYSS